MTFSKANIDRAIVQTQYDLRGFQHPHGFRLDRDSSTGLFYSVINFMPIAAGFGTTEVQDKPPGYITAHKSTYEQYLDACKSLGKACDPTQREAILYLLREILEMHTEIEEKISSGKLKESGYLLPLEKNNYWGKVLLALTEAFYVVIKSEKATQPIAS